MSINKQMPKKEKALIRKKMSAHRYSMPQKDYTFIFNHLNMIGNTDIWPHVLNILTVVDDVPLNIQDDVLDLLYKMEDMSSKNMQSIFVIYHCVRLWPHIKVCAWNRLVANIACNNTNVIGYIFQIIKHANRAHRTLGDLIIVFLLNNFVAHNINTPMKCIYFKNLVSLIHDCSIQTENLEDSKFFVGLFKKFFNCAANRLTSKTNSVWLHSLFFSINAIAQTGVDNTTKVCAYIIIIQLYSTHVLDIDNNNKHLF